LRFLFFCVPSTLQDGLVFLPPSPVHHPPFPKLFPPCLFLMPVFVMPPPVFFFKTARNLFQRCFSFSPPPSSLSQPGPPIVSFSPPIFLSVWLLEFPTFLFWFCFFVGSGFFVPLFYVGKQIALSLALPFPSSCFFSPGPHLTSRESGGLVFFCGGFCRSLCYSFFLFVLESFYVRSLRAFLTFSTD